MLTKCVIASVISVGILIWGAGAAFGQQDYPNKPVRIVTGEAGGGKDVLARLVAQRISVPMGQPVIVENRAGGFVPGQVVSQALPNGYTLLLYGDSFHTAPLLQKAPYDAVKDFAAIAKLTIESNMFVVNPSLPAKSIKELIALAKARPGELNYASSGVGTGSHLGAELFKSMAGVNMVHVAYKGAPASIAALLSGDVHLRIISVGTGLANIKAGKLRGLAVTGAKPSALAPGMPTVAATLPGYEMVGLSGVWAPAKTPEAIIKRLNQEMIRIVNEPDVKQKLFNSGVEVDGGSPEELEAAVIADTARMSKVIKEAGIKVE